jgi:DNA helicase II / ATP-dependent DNA helicase PcrA
MKLIVDLHTHSHYSRATSANMNLEAQYKWAKIKGVNVLGTGDFTHPMWFKEIQEKLEPAEPGLFALKPELAGPIDAALPESISKQKLRYILSSEISCIYSKNEKVRKTHNLIIAPDFKTVSEMNLELSRIGNLKADGRPILGLDSKRLLELSLKVSPDNLYIPAHIWTPWFSLYGSRSGFDSLSEAYEELANKITAVETGLSSDPYMNWRIKDLDGITLVSNSDAHSAQKLGREANVIATDWDYFKIINAINTGGPEFLGTIEFFPQEGRYHYDGHRNCGIVFSPAETEQHHGICPKCGKPLVVGVDNRVNKLAEPDRPETYRPKKHKQVEYIVPVPELLAGIFKVKSVLSKKVVAEYEKVYTALGPEFSITRTIPVSEIIAAGFPELANAIERLRSGDVVIKPGYDGVYGIIKVVDDNTRGQIGLI